MSAHRVVNPEALGTPKGYSQGILASKGQILFVSGQIGWDVNGWLVGTDLVSQFEQALRNVLTVVSEAGGKADHIGRLTIYVVDKHAYLKATKDIGQAYRGLMGKHFPAMALVQVADLLEEGALVEIEATAVI